MTLFERRVKQRDDAVNDLLDMVKLLEKSRGESPASIRRQTQIIKDYAAKAHRYADLAEDLHNVQQYGPDGGRT